VKAVLLDGTEVEFSVGKAWCGVGFRSVTVESRDLMADRFIEYFEVIVMARLSKDLGSNDG